MTKASRPDLSELLERVEAASGPDRELDANLWQQFTPGATRRQSTVKSAKGLWADYTIDETREASGLLIVVPTYTASIDATSALTRRLFPDACLIMTCSATYSCAELVEGWGYARERSLGSVCERSDDEIALCLLAVLLQAKIAEGEG